jgi:hypothetical protein
LIRWLTVLSFVLIGAQPAVKKGPAAPPEAADGPAYTAEGQLKFPEDYREWVFLTSGLDMSYAPNAAAAKHSVFNNVFVNPSAYKVFVKTGTWPEGSMFMLENRGAEGNHSINTRGLTQAVEVTGTELHVKDSAHGGWAFYNFDEASRNPKGSALMIPKAATCYACHEQHAAVDTTFVQFYPTLLGVAKEKGSLSAEYLKEMEAPAAAAK